MYQVEIKLESQIKWFIVHRCTFITSVKHVSTSAQVVAALICFKNLYTVDSLCLLQTCSILFSAHTCHGVFC